MPFMALVKVFFSFQLPGEERPPVTIPPLGASQHPLPDNFALVPAVALTATAISVPKLAAVTNRFNPA